jgi:hypothetical protein
LPIFSWETGRRKPSGAALRLLQIVRVAPEILPRLSVPVVREKPTKKYRV